MIADWFMAGIALALTPATATIIIVAQTLPPDVGGGLTQIANLGANGVVCLLLAYEFIWRGPAREKAVDAVHQRHEAHISEIIEAFKQKQA